MRLIDCGKLRDELGTEVLMEEVDGDNSIDDIIANMPTVEAIPVEWLHSYIYNFNNFKFDDEREVLKKMIEDWREENESNTNN